MEFDRKKQRASTAGAASNTHTPGRRSLTQDLAPIRRQAPPPDAELITSDPASHEPHAVQRSSDGQDMPGLEEAEPANRRGAKRSQGGALDRVPKRRSTRGTTREEDTGDEPSSVLDQVLAATGRNVSGTKQPIELLGGRAQVFVPTQPQILFHGTSTSFDRLLPGQVYISDYATALRNGHIKMAIEIVQPLRLLDLSDRTTVETLLRSPGAAAIHAHLTATTGLSVEGDEIRGSFRKGTVGASDDAMCAWTQTAGCDGFARLAVDGKGFPELAVHAVAKLRVVGRIDQRDRFTEVAGDSA